MHKASREEIGFDKIKGGGAVTSNNSKGHTSSGITCAKITDVKVS